MATVWQYLDSERAQELDLFVSYFIENASSALQFDSFNSSEQYSDTACMCSVTPFLTLYQMTVIQ